MILPGKEWSQPTSQHWRGYYKDGYKAYVCVLRPWFEKGWKYEDKIEAMASEARRLSRREDRNEEADAVKKKAWRALQESYRVEYDRIKAGRSPRPYD